MSRIAFYATWKAIPISGVTHFTKAHSFWRDFCRPSYAVCGCRHAAPAKMATKSCQHSNFYPSQQSCTALDPTNCPR